MSSKIILKKSSVLTDGIPKAPQPADLEYGELAINYAAGKLYYKKSDNTIQSIGSAGSTISIGTSPPASPQAGTLWWNSEEGTLKVYYTDSNTSQWVDASAGINSLTSGGVSLAEIRKTVSLRI